MTLMAIGLLLFAGLHLIKSLAPGLRSNLQQRMGENGYKGIFALLVLSSVAMIIFGWRSAVPRRGPLMAKPRAGSQVLLVSSSLRIPSCRKKVSVPSYTRRL